MAVHGEKCIHLYFCSELAVITILTVFALRDRLLLIYIARNLSLLCKSNLLIAVYHRLSHFSAGISGVVGQYGF